MWMDFMTTLLSDELDVFPTIEVPFAKFEVQYKTRVKEGYTLKINMEPTNGGLEDDVPFQVGWWLGEPAVQFQGCKTGGFI